MTMSPVRDGESDSAVCEPLTQRGHRVRACRTVRVGVGYLEIDLTIQRQFEQEITFTGYCLDLTEIFIGSDLVPGSNVTSNDISSNTSMIASPIEVGGWQPKPRPQ